MEFIQVTEILEIYLDEDCHGTLSEAVQVAVKESQDRPETP